MARPQVDCAFYIFNNMSPSNSICSWYILINSLLSSVSNFLELLFHPNPYEYQEWILNIFPQFMYLNKVYVIETPKLV